MPEGHTVHRLAGAFTGAFVGRVVRASSPQGRFDEGAAALDGLRLEAAEAQGKVMFLAFRRPRGKRGLPVWLRVHLGLYGMWRFHGPDLAGFGRRTRGPVSGGIPEPRGAVRLRLLASDRVADLSGPTACALATPEEKAADQARLGDDPLRADADPERAWRKLSGSRSAVGLLLMRQDIIAGIGNIYRAELLFQARQNPHVPGRQIARPAFDAMWTDLAALLAAGVQTGRIVTTLPADRGGGRGRGAATYVAHRAGRPCRVCGTAVLAEAMAGRTLYWCPTCQA